MTRVGLVLALVAGCSSSGKSGADLATPPDLGPMYPAAHAAAPQAMSLGGPVLAAPKVVPISFDGDALRPMIDDFVGKLAASSYWTRAVGEYGVGALTALTPIHSSDTPAATLTDGDIQSWLKSKLAAGAPFPTPDANTIYAIFYPSNVTLNDGSGTSCNQFNAYHSDFLLSAGKYVTYVAVPRCPPPVAGLTPFDMLTATTSHELIEAATDPLAQDKPAWAAVDDDHVAFAIVGGGAELGDLCAGFPNSFYTPSGLSFIVQRIWSNASAAAGHDPCQPDGASPYFNASPLFNDTVSVDVPGLGTVQSKGLRVPVGGSGTVELDLFSDAPTSGAWNVSAIDVASAFMGGARELGLTLDQSMGQNGDKLTLTVKALKADPSGAAAFWIENDLGSTSTVWLGLVGN